MTNALITYLDTYTSNGYSMKNLLSQRTTALLGLLLIALGVVLGYAPLRRMFSERDQQVSASAVIVPPTETVNTSEEEAAISGKPIHLTIDSIGYDGEVIDGTYNAADQSWTLSKDKPHFATPSTLANNKSGNTFIYGHNNKHVFAQLSKIQLGDQAVVTTDNGHRFIYEYYSLTVTSPQDTSLFSYDGPPVLTLQTCSGIWYENRSLYAFKLMEVL